MEGVDFAPEKVEHGQEKLGGGKNEDGTPHEQIRHPPVNGFLTQAHALSQGPVSSAVQIVRATALDLSMALLLLMVGYSFEKPR